MKDISFPRTYYSPQARHFTEKVLVPKFASALAADSSGQPLRGADKCFIVEAYHPLEVIVRNFRMTLCAYSNGGEFLHQVRNCLYIYLSAHFSREEISRIFAQVFVISAAANNPVLENAPNFRLIRILNYYDEIVIKKLALKRYYPSRRVRKKGNLVVPLNENETLIWVNIPYKFKNYGYIDDVKVITRLINYGYHLERSYFNPVYFPDYAYRALLQSLTSPQLAAF